MTIKELLSTLKQPEHPYESGANEKWGAVTSKIGTPLPTDYMQFIDLFGSGTISSFLNIFNPFSRNPHINFFEQVFTQLAALRELRTNFPEFFPYPLFFEPGGLLPWGISIDGDVFCWLTSGSSESWHTVVLPRAGDSQLFSLTMTQFLAGFITGAINPAAVSTPFAQGGKAHFEPFLR